MDKIIVYTDGSTLGNGTADSWCGWACKLIWHGHECMKSGGAIGMTNNQMEMTAVLEAMRSITDKTIPVELYSDSRYVVETLNGHFAIKKNQKLWAELMREKKKFSNIRFLWVKGHDKNRHNIDVDRQAVEESKRAYGRYCGGQT
jgi:ribonuclease HI